MTVISVPKQIIPVATRFCLVSFSELKRGAMSRFHTRERAPRGASRDYK